MESIAVLDKGFIRLDAYCASDLDVVNAARVSYAQRSTAMSDADVGLIGFLMREHHGTPFEHTYFRFHVKAPIFVYREWHRHRIGISINEQSGRYMQLEREYYVPDSDVRIQVGKAGRYTYEDASAEMREDVRMEIIYACDESFDAYERMLKMGVAKEIARLVLPVNTYSQMYWSCNARSLMAFINLRSAPNAQREIRYYSETMERIFAEVMPHTYDFFKQNGMVAP